MTELSRRTLLASTAVLGIGILAGCTAETPNPAPSTGTGGGAPEGTGDGDRFGVGRYNTQDVADELMHIEQTVQPLTAGEMKRVFITGSTGGLGQLAAAYLLRRGHHVVVHARNAQRAADVRRDLPNVEEVVIGDLSNLDEVEALASQVNERGPFDVIIHNAGEYDQPGEVILNVNVLAPYILTCLVDRPAHVMYLTSSLNNAGDLKPDVVRAGGVEFTYNDSKLHILMLALATNRLWPDVKSQAVGPGWVRTLMGNLNGEAPGHVRDGYTTQVWLTEGIEPASREDADYFYRQAPETHAHPSARDTAAQDELLAAYAARTGVAFPTR